MAHQIQKISKVSKNIIGLRFLSSSGSANAFDAQKTQSSKMHLAVQRDYPQAAALPLPSNVDPNEAMRFSPLRNRDITASAISVHQEISRDIDVTLEQRNEIKEEKLELHDAHLDSYDRSQPVNLSSVMQTLVPEPFSPPKDDLLNSSYLSYPGGSWGQQTKYLSHELNASHYTQLRQEMRSDWSSYKGGILKSSLMPNLCLLHHNSLSINHKRFISLSAVNPNNAQESPNVQKPEKESAKSKLKKAVKEYGTTVIVFHVGISLISLGLFYTLVSSGLDVMMLLEKVNLADKVPKFAENASTFIIAYAVHKIFAPVRISITLASTPFIVRYLRNKNILKK